MPISPDRILYEDEHLLFVNKLSGELVVKGAGKVQKLPLYDFLKKEYPTLRPLNRLDYLTSGIVIFAKTKQGYEEARKTMHDWKKTYRTIVAGRVGRKTGVISKTLPARSRRDEIEAVTRYHVLAQGKHCAYVECAIDTGRFHQIRRHFASIHHPLVLDEEYGEEKFNKMFSRMTKFRKFFLHAWKVELEHPVTGKKLVVEAPIPRAFEQVMGRLQ